MRKLPRGTLDKWLQFDSVEPIGEQRLQTAEITALLHRLTAHTLASYGTEMKPIKIDGYMPPRYRPEESETPKKRSKPEDDFTQVAAAFGLGKVIAKYGRNNQSR
jgi:hypothetical protein